MEFLRVLSISAYVCPVPSACRGGGGGCGWMDVVGRGAGEGRGEDDMDHRRGGWLNMGCAFGRVGRRSVCVGLLSALSLQGGGMAAAGQVLMY